MHCLWVKSSNRTHGQFECDETWLCFNFDFVRSHALCDLCSIVCWRGEGSFKIRCPRSRGWENFGRRWTGGWKSWKLDNFYGRHISIVPFYYHKNSSSLINKNFAIDYLRFKNHKKAYFAINVLINKEKTSDFWPCFFYLFKDH